MKPRWDTDDWIASRMGTEFWGKHALTEKGWVIEQKTLTEAEGERRAGKETWEAAMLLDRKCRAFLWATKGLRVFSRLIWQSLPSQQKFNVIDGLIFTFGYQMIMNTFYGWFVMSVCSSPFFFCPAAEISRKQKWQRAHSLRPAT